MISQSYPAYLSCLLAIEYSIMFFVSIYRIVGWGVEVLIKASLSVQCLVSLITFRYELVN